MFNQVFKYKFYKGKFSDGPLVPYLDDFAADLFDRGFNRPAVRNRFVVIGRLNDWLKKKKILISGIDDAQIARFTKAESKRVYSLTERGDLATIRLFVELLRKRGVVSVEKGPRPTPIDKMLGDFRRHLENEHGVCIQTIETYIRYSRHFSESCFGKSGVNFRNLSNKKVNQYFLKVAKRFSPGTTRLVATSTKAFLRYLKFRGFIEIDLSPCIPSIPVFQATNLPYFLSLDDQRKLLGSFDKAALCGRRDYAMILLMLRLGIRGCEVARLSIDDIDWVSGELTLQGKGRQAKLLPLPSDVGLAIVKYLKIRNQKNSSRSLFLSSFPPFNPVDRKLVGIAVRAAVARAGLKPYRSGSHLLRHTAATQMLHRGASLSEIGMVLGHQAIKTTAIYAKVDIATITPLARRWPKALSMGDNK